MSSLIGIISMVPVVPLQDTEIRTGRITRVSRSMCIPAGILALRSCLHCTLSRDALLAVLTPRE